MKRVRPVRAVPRPRRPGPTGPPDGQLGQHRHAHRHVDVVRTGSGTTASTRVVAASSSRSGIAGPQWTIAGRPSAATSTRTVTPAACRATTAGRRGERSAWLLDDRGRRGGRNRPDGGSLRRAGLRPLGEGVLERDLLHLDRDAVLLGEHVGELLDDDAAGLVGPDDEVGVTPGRGRAALVVAAAVPVAAVVSSAPAAVVTTALSATESSAVRRCCRRRHRRTPRRSATGR